MTYKFTTPLKWFTLGETFIDYTLWIEWYAYNPADLLVKGLDHRQVPLVEAYLNGLPNFEAIVSYQPAYEEEIPGINADDLIDNPAIDYPSFLLLGNPNIPSDPGIAKCMDIQLCTEAQQPLHHYDLDFPLFGKILGFKE